MTTIEGLSAAFVARALGTGPAPSLEFSGVTSDSRGDVAGRLFVAIAGERFDGHAFVEQAVRAGAAGAIVQREWAAAHAPQVPVYAVDDTLAAYRRLAGAWRRRFDIPVIAIGGAAGKTTTKDLIAALLRGRYRNVLATEGSRNGYLGLAMTLMELRPEHDAAVIEIGIDAPGAMAEHAELVQPGLALVTMIGPEHLASLGDVATVAAEEGRLLDWTSAHGGVICVNDADPWLAPYAARATRYRLADTPAGAGPEDLRGMAEDGRLALFGLGFGGEELALPLPGRHNALNLLAAVSIAARLGLNSDQIRTGLATFRPPFARSNLVDLPRGVTVLADYYNASPVSMPAAFAALAELGERRRWLCLGDMLELGADELKLHAALAAPIRQLGAHGVLLYGERMAALAEALKKTGFAGICEHFDDKAELAEFLVGRIEAGDAVLIKGSRGMRLEEVMDRLTG
jgi:UDP-N-acetylmuramoyl-tripeptide--D-alanyl-D-alanine ligase